MGQWKPMGMKVAVQRKRLLLLGIIGILLYASGCMDQDPFNLSQRKVIGLYSLERFEGNLYYLQNESSCEDHGGGCLDGTIEQIGWTNDLIFAKRHANFHGDPDGWMVVDVRNQSISGPLTESEFRSKYPSVKVLPPKEAWKKL
jgi:hypothetical protein